MHFIKFITVSAVFSNYRRGRIYTRPPTIKKQTLRAALRTASGGGSKGCSQLQVTDLQPPPPPPPPSQSTDHPPTRLRFGKENSHRRRRRRGERTRRAKTRAAGQPSGSKSDEDEARHGYCAPLSWRFSSSARHLASICAQTLIKFGTGSDWVFT